MNKRKIIEKARKYVEKQLKKEPPCHDYWHTYRVWQLSKYIGKKEGADLFVVELAALFHDIADWKFHGEGAAQKKARKWLKQNSVDEKTINHVCGIICNLSFKGARVKVSKMNTIEGKVVQDADGVEGLGAIGIARTFTYGGVCGRPIYDPKINQSCMHPPKNTLKVKAAQ